MASGALESARPEQASPPPTLGRRAGHQKKKWKGDSDDHLQEDRCVVRGAAETPNIPATTYQAQTHHGVVGINRPGYKGCSLAGLHGLVTSNTCC